MFQTYGHTALQRKRKKLETKMKVFFKSTNIGDLKTT